MGGDKKRLLRNLPDKFEDIHVLNPDKKDAVTKLWKSQLWAKHLLSMKGPGYDKKNPITPHIRIMVNHCPHFLQQYGNLKKFTGQGVEKKKMMSEEISTEKLISGMHVAL